MSEVKVKVKELVEVKYRILGMEYKALNEDGSVSDKVIDKWKGFLTQKDVTEGVKRRIRKILKAVEAELADIDVIAEQLSSEKQGEELLKALKELDNDEVTLSGIELCDFSKVENLIFCEEDGSPCDYSLLYDKFFV